jgi:hypothetical protein
MIRDRVVDAGTERLLNMDACREIGENPIMSPLEGPWNMDACRESDGDPLEQTLNMDAYPGSRV